MKWSRTIAACVLLAVCSLAACGGVASDGGQSGTGISAIRGNVVAVTGGATVNNIRVSLSGTNLVTRTDAGGHFELRGDAGGPGELRFEREEDGLSARTDVVVPAGGVLELEQIVLNRKTGEARPMQRRVEFEGFVQTLDCANGLILVISKEEEDRTVFSVDTTSATIRRNGQLLACSDLRVGDRLEMRGETADGATIVNAEIKLEDREDSPDIETNEPEDSGDAGDDQSEDLESNDSGSDSHDDEQLQDDEGEDPADDDQVDEEAEIRDGHEDDAHPGDDEAE